MSTKRVNSTGRKKILREDARFFVRADDTGTFIFDTVLTLDEYELPPDAQIFVEAYRQTTFMRFEHGTVASPGSAAKESRRLSEFATRDGLLFRLKITSTGQRPGLLLAEADQISISDNQDHPDKRIPLLPVVPQDLGDELWRVAFGDDSSPLLAINENLHDWNETAKSTLFQSIVFPAAMREILWHILVVDKFDDADEPDHWAAHWLKFAETLGSGDPPESDALVTDKEEWIDLAVAAFARRNGILKEFKNALELEAAI